MSKRNRVIVRINGAEYVLIGEEQEDYMFTIANYTNKKIKEILNSNPKHSNTSAAVLAALTIVDELFKSRRESEVLKKRLGEPEEKYQVLKEDFDKLLEEYNNIKEQYDKTILDYEGNCSDYEGLKGEYEELNVSIDKKNTLLEDLLRENAYLKEQNKGLEEQIKEIKEEGFGLKDELIRKQTELLSYKHGIENKNDHSNRK